MVAWTFGLPFVQVTGHLSSASNAVENSDALRYLWYCNCLHSYSTRGTYVRALRYPDSHYRPCPFLALRAWSVAQFTCASVTRGHTSMLCCYSTQCHVGVCYTPLPFHHTPTKIDAKGTTMMARGVIDDGEPWSRLLVSAKAERKKLYTASHFTN